jgi:hypothetical protein
MSSTIDRTQPSFHGPLATAPLRNNFNRAADDIEALQAIQAKSTVATVWKTANQAVAGTVLTAVPELVQNLAAGSRYTMSALIRWSSLGAGGITYGFTLVGAGSDVRWSDPSTHPGWELAAGQTISTSASGTFQATPIGEIVTGSAIATLTLEFALNLADANPATVLAGSWLQCTKV